jgi:hypothetical protein
MTSFLVAACQDCPEVTAGSAEQVNGWANAHRAATGRVNRLSAGPAVPEDTATRPWREGDIAYDRTGFVHVRYAQGWRTHPRTTGTQYGDDVMEAHLGPLVRLAAVPPGTSDVGALPRDFVRRANEVDDYNDDLIPTRPECTVAGCTHPQWRDRDVCQFHVPLKGNVEVRSHPRPAGDES